MAQRPNSLFDRVADIQSVEELAAKRENHRKADEYQAVAEESRLHRHQRSLRAAMRELFSTEAAKKVKRFSTIRELPADFDTDHTVLEFSLRCRIQTRQDLPRKVYNFKRADWLGLSAHLESLRLSESVIDPHDIDSAWEAWSSAVQSAVDMFVPSRNLKVSTSPPWIDGEVRNLQNKKRTAWKRAKRSDSPSHWEKFRKLRNKLKNLLSAKYNKYLVSLSSTLQESPKRFWAFVRAKSKSRSLPTDVHLNGTVVQSAPDKANMFNDYFFSTFSAPDPNVIKPDIDVIVDERLCNLLLAVESVENVLVNLNTSKAVGPDNISAHVLKGCAKTLAPSLTLLFNKSLSAGCVPSRWKDANVLPVHKKGDKENVANYRPVSLLSLVSKVMERCMYNQLIPMLRGSLHEFQHGFIAGRSTTTQLVETYHQVGSILDKGGQVDMLFLDFAKAFDFVSHTLLLHKLQMFGFGGNLLAWFTSYLTDRRQRVVVEGCQSKWLPSRKLMSLVEGVQRRATKFIQGAQSNTLTYKERLSTLGLLPLAHRREVCDVMVFIKSKPIVHKPSRYLRSHMLTPIRVRTSAFSSSYIPRLVTIWNQLSPVLRNIGVQASEMSNILTFIACLLTGNVRLTLTQFWTVPTDDAGMHGWTVVVSLGKHQHASPTFSKVLEGAQDREEQAWLKDEDMRRRFAKFVKNRVAWAAEKGKLAKHDKVDISTQTEAEGKPRWFANTLPNCVMPAGEESQQAAAAHRTSTTTIIDDEELVPKTGLCRRMWKTVKRRLSVPAAEQIPTEPDAQSLKSGFPRGLTAV
ncbi:hypothetical protein Bbelb_200370 [Branchiostoma belcheri]|nr:hypothetical protein Bbelb_200370 [Branchiostoma belcheri]